jgi:6-pyruvoyltetrahydropterin/6-carboxytetrahydropterin synthase
MLHPLRHQQTERRMKKIRVTKEFSFEMAHALWNYDGACRNIHGHSYRLFVTIIGEPEKTKGHPKFGMVMDFKDLKQLVRTSVIDLLDHALIVYKEAEGESLDAVRAMYEKVHVFDFQPTCENLVEYIAEILERQLPAGTDLFSLKLYETATSYAEWFASDNH